MILRMGVIEETEAALVAHWSLLGRAPGGALRDEHGIRWYETPVPSLPYNGVVAARLPDGPDADATIARVLSRFRSRGVQHVWFVTPSVTPNDLGSRLEAQGLQPVERMTYMSFELTGWRPRPLSGAATVEEVRDDAGLLVYNKLTAAYWELPPEQEKLVLQLQRALGPGRVPGHRYVAWLDGEPIGKAYLSLAGAPGVAAFYGMSVRPQARGRGIAKDLSLTLLARAQDQGCHRLVIHSSDAGRELYRRLGFVENAVFPVYASGSIWSGTH